MAATQVSMSKNGDANTRRNAVMYAPTNSSRFFNEVVPTIGAETPTKIISNRNRSGSDCIR